MKDNETEKIRQPEEEGRKEMIFIKERVSMSYFSRVYISCVGAETVV